MDELVFVLNSGKQGQTDLSSLEEVLISSGYDVSIIPSWLESAKRRGKLTEGRKVLSESDIRYLLSELLARLNTANAEFPSLALKVEGQEWVVRGVALQVPNNKVQVTKIQDFKAPEPVVEKSSRPVLQPSFQKQVATKYSLNWITENSEKVYAQMQKNGIPLDLKYLENLAAQSQELLKQALDVVERLSGVRPRPSSTPEMEKALTAVAVKPPRIRGKITITKDWLEKQDNPVARALAQAKAAQYEASTAKSVLAKAKQGRAYPVYVMQEELGRPHAAEINYMNWPPSIKASIRAEPGHFLAEVDFKAAEIRVLAALSHDSTLLSILKEGKDIHTETASEIFNKPVSEVTSEERRRAKTVNFGIVNGQEARGLARELNISEAEAQRYINAFFRKFSGVAKFIIDTVDQARAEGKVRTLHGRERSLSNLLSTDPQKAARLASNHKIQSGLADLMRIGLVHLNDAIKKVGGFVLGTIHDAYLLSVPQSVSPLQLRQMVQQAVVTQNEPEVPLAVDIRVGYSLSQMKEVA